MTRRLLLLVFSLILIVFVVGCSSPDEPIVLFYHGNVNNVIKTEPSYTLNQYVIAATPEGNIILPDNPNLLIFDDKGLPQFPIVQWIQQEDCYSSDPSIVGDFWIYKVAKKNHKTYYVFSPTQILNWDSGFYK